MSKNNIIELAGRDTIIDPLSALLRSGAGRLKSFRDGLQLFAWVAKLDAKRIPDFSRLSPGGKPKALGRKCRMAAYPVPRQPPGAYRARILHYVSV